MSLPYPHGTGSGQIGNGSVIDDNDTPGSTGGRFVGFGEFGLSKYNNRGLWALSVNIDYIYQTYSAAKAIPAFAQFTSTGQDSYALTGSVFVGNNTYPGGSPPSTADRMLGISLLLTLADSNFGVLTDASGNEVRVYDIRTPADSATVYKGGPSPPPGFNGFWTAPLLKFCTVDPVTLAVINADYTIPNGTVVNVIYGQQASLETLPVDGLLKVLFNKSGVPAGVILQNGTRPMLGNLNMNGYNLINVHELNAGTQIMVLKDFNITGGISLSETGESTLFHGSTAAHASVLGMINSATNTLMNVMQNRVVSRADVMSFDPVTGIVVVPAGDIYTINGETFTVPSPGFAAVVPANTVDYFLAIDHDALETPARALITVPVSTPAAGLSASSVIVGRARRSLGGAFTISQDLRTAGRWQAGKLEIFVGADTQCDFSDLQQAIDFVTAYGLCVPSSPTTHTLAGWRPRIIVRSDLTIGNDTYTIATLPATGTSYTWEFIGEASSYSAVDTASLGTVTLIGRASHAVGYLLEANDNTVSMRNISFAAGFGNDGVAAIHNAGTGSTFDNCSFAYYYTGLGAALSQSADRGATVSFTGCGFYKVASTAITSHGKVLIDDCFFTDVANTASAGYCLVLAGGGKICNSRFDATAAALYDATIYIGADLPQPGGGAINATAEIRNCVCKQTGVRIVYPTAAETASFVVSGNVFLDVAGVAIDGDNSGGQPVGPISVSITSNSFQTCATDIKFDMTHASGANLVSITDNIAYHQQFVGSGIYLKDAGNIVVRGNAINATSIPLVVTGGSYGTISDNTIVDWQNSGVAYAISIGAGTQPVHVRNNQITMSSLVTVGQTGYMYITARDACEISGNKFSFGDSAIAVGFGILVSLSTGLSIRNNSVSYTMLPTVGASQCPKVKISSNTLEGCPAASAVIDIAGCPNYLVADNTIDRGGSVAIEGGGVYVRPLSGVESSGIIRGNSFVMVQGNNLLTASNNTYCVIEVKPTNLGTSNTISNNRILSCGITSVGIGSYVYAIKGDGVCCVSDNYIIDQKGPTTGTTVFQYGIHLGIPGSPVSGSSVTGNKILCQQTSSGDLHDMTTGFYFGIYMVQDGVIQGNTLFANYSLASHPCNTSYAIFVDTGMHVAVVGNVTKNIGIVQNQSIGITVGNIGDSIAPYGDLIAHTNGNTSM